jgi:putative DNA primase/helicase
MENCDLNILINEGEDVISIKNFATAIEYEAELGKLFLSYNQSFIDGKLIPHFVYCNKYFYSYDVFTAIWKEIEVDFLISIVESWVKHQFVILARAGKDFEQLLNTSKQLKKVLKYKYLESVVKLLKHEIADESFFDKLDRSQPDWLPIKDNQVINLQTSEVRQRSISDYFSWECPVKPVKGVNPEFLKIISSIMCDNTENLAYFQKMMGYCLTGSKEAQSYFIWYGKGSNGKSLILNLLKAVLGKACDPVAKSVLMDCGKKGNNGTEVISLKDLRLGTFSETNAQEALNESMLKMLSGGDKIKARGLYKDEISFELFLKLIICTNNKPEFNGGDFGTVRRIKFLPFEAKFTKTPTKQNEYPIIENLEQLLVKEYLNDFFTFCLEGANAWYNDKTFQDIPKGVRAQQDAYTKEQNTFGSWFGDRVIVSKDSKLKRSEAYHNYSAFCSDLGTKPLIKKEFLQKLGEECGKEVKKSGDIVYLGFELKEEEEDSDDEITVSCKKLPPKLPKPGNSKMFNNLDDGLDV